MIEAGCAYLKSLEGLFIGVAQSGSQVVTLANIRQKWIVSATDATLPSVAIK